MHRVSGPLGHDSAKDTMSRQSQIANQVKHFMTHKFVFVAKGSVLYRASAEDDGVLFRRSANQAHVAQHLLVFTKPEGTGGSNLRAVGAGGEVDGECLAADWVGEMDVVGNAVAFSGVNSDELAVLPHFYVFQDAQVLPAATLAPDPHLGKGFYVGQGAAVQDGQLQVIQFDDDVVYTRTDQRRQKMLGGGDEHSLAHDAGGVANLGYIPAGGCDLVVIQVSAAENDA